MLTDLPIYFIDIETVSAENPSRLSVPPVLFFKKFAKEAKTDDAQEMMKFYADKAALHAEFCKIVCISMGVLKNGKFYIKTIVGDDEKKLLIEAEEQIAQAKTILAHNGLEFDFPMWMRRAIINNTPIPSLLKTAGKKIWDVKDQLLDTMQMWSGTAYNYRVSLALLANVLSIPDPKKDMDGSKIGELYYSTDPDRLNKIGEYCTGDVWTAFQVYLRMKGEELITEDQIIYK